MKEFYNLLPFDFGIKITFFDGEEEKELDTIYSYERYKGLDLKTIRYLFLIDLANKGINIQDIQLSGLKLYAVIRGLVPSNGIKTNYELTNTHDLDIDDRSIDLAFAKSLLDYPIDDGQKQMFALDFLQRYAIYYDGVKEFVEKGKQDLDKMDSILDTNSQVTSRKR